LLGPAGMRQSSHMNADYQAALTDIVRRTRQNQLTSKWPNLTFVLGPRRITRYLARSARTVADELDHIEPPAEVAAEHFALVHAAQKAATDLLELAAREDLRAFERFEAIGELQLGGVELAALEAKGYRLRA
jgi:hypothetical protein